MTIQTTICLVIFTITIVSYILNKIPMALTSMLAMFVMVVTGCIDSATVLAGFSEPSTVIMVSMFVVAAGLNRTQMVSKISNLVYKVSGGSFTKGLLGYVLVTVLIAQVVPSAILIFGICYPLTADFCRKMNVSPSKAMFSIGITAISCVGALPIGSGAVYYLTQNGHLASYGITDYSFGMFDLMWAKLPIMIFMVLYAVFVAPRFAPDRDNIVDNKSTKTAAKKPLGPVREVLGYSIFVGVVLGLVFIDYLPLESWQVCMGGALLTILTGVLSEKEAISQMNLPVAFLFVGGLTMGKALVATGAGDYIGKIIAGLLGNNPNGYVVGLVFFLIPFLLTQVMVNYSVLHSTKPIVMMTCIALGYNPIGPIILANIGALTAFMTPMATPTIPLMMGVAGYTQKDMFKMSWLPAIIICAVAVLWVMTIFPV